MPFHYNLVMVDEISETKIIKINDSNILIFKHLAQGYEAEFSALTKKMPNREGIFELDIQPINDYDGYLFYYKNIPVGFCMVGTKEKAKDIAEFYIIPSMRKQKLGFYFARWVFFQYPGLWQVKQIEGADYATNFWRYVIGSCTCNQYTENIIVDPYWGKVTCQQFTIKT